MLTTASASPICRKNRLIGFAAFLVMVFIFSLDYPAAAFAAEEPPSGFVAVSDAKMTWAEAKTFCEQKGGKLPLIGGSEGFGKEAGYDVRPGKDTPVDGFGAIGGSWPAGISKGGYWTGTANTHPDKKEYVWRVSATKSDNTGVGDYHRIVQPQRAACVPK